MIGPVPMRHVVCTLLWVAACKGPAEMPPDYFGTTVAPPRGLDRLRLGESRTEAMAAVPGLKPTIDGSELELMSGVRHVQLIVSGDPVLKIFARVSSPANAKLAVNLADHWGTQREVSPNHYRGDTWIAEIHPIGGVTDIVWSPKIDVKAWFGAGPGSLPAPVAKVKPGMMKNEIAAVAPAAGYVVEENTLLTFPDSSQPGGVRTFGMELALDHRDALLGLWGPGETVQITGFEPHEAHVWYTPATGWRTTLRIATKKELASGLRTADYLSWERYTPLASVLGNGQELAMTASSPWGKPLAELQKDFPGITVNTLDLTPTEFGPRTGFFIPDAKTNGAADALVVRFACDAKCDALAGTFAAKWGAPKGDIYHATAPFVRVHKEGPELVMTYRPTPPPKDQTVY